MRSTTTRIALVAALLACVAAPALATPPPERVSFQGVLRGSDGSPVDGSPSMSFRLYDAGTGCPGGGTLLLIDDQGTVPVADGLFTVAIGSGTLISGTASGLGEAFRGSDEVWVEIVVGGESLCPRVRVESAAYAQLAGGLRTLDDVGIGTTTPNRPLTVAPNAFGDTIQLVSTGGGSDWHLSFSGTGLEFVETGVAGGRLFLQDGGNVGVGTTNPIAKLDVAGPIRTTSGGIEFPDGTVQTTSAEAHTHPGEDIVSGTVAEPRIDDLIARDAEIDGAVRDVLASQSCPADRAVIGFDALGDAVCSQGGCPAGETDCGGVCVDTQIDDDNCGDCNVACGASGRCDEGSCIPFPVVADNTATLEISAVATVEVVVISGPAADIQRIRSFPYDYSGLNQERDLVFEYSGPAEAALAQFNADYLATGTVRSISLIVDDSQGSEVFRWNLFEYGLATITAGNGGRNRYTLVHDLSPDNLMSVEEGGSTLPGRDLASCNPATDTQVEISGILFGRWPVVEDDPVAKTLTLTFDYIEGGGVFAWFEQMAEQGTDALPRRSGSVIVETSPCSGTEQSRTNYFELFPIAYEAVEGFSQAVKIKERVVLAYTFQEPG